MKMAPNSSKTIIFNKGINETRSALELGASELYSCINYELSSGSYAGLQLTTGYEIYDGTQLASEIDVVKDVDGIVTDWSAREARTAAILPPNSDVTPILAVFEYNDDVFCIKPDSTDSDRHYIYIAEATGWTSVSEVDTVLHEAAGTDTQIYKFYMGRMHRFNDNKEFVVFANGISKPFILHWDGETYQVTTIDGGNMLPSSDYESDGTTPRTDRQFPTIPIIWEQQLFLAYPEGNIFWCQTGADPTSIAGGALGANPWDPSVSTAGNDYFEDTVTNLVIAPSSMVIFCEHMIKAFKKSTPDAVTGVAFTVDTYSDKSGAIWNTAQRILGTILFCDDRGISTLDTTNAYGDFEASVISRNAHRSYEENKDNIIGAIVNRERNQYKVCTNTGRGLVVSFKADKTLKGMTNFEYPDIPNCGYECAWIGGADGSVYKLHEGAQSFNNAKIEASITTSYFTYNTPLNFKTFKRGLLELQAERGTEITFRPLFDYSSPDTPNATKEELDTSKYTPATAWGDGVWGTFVWGGTAELREWIYFPGIANNMALRFTTSTRFYTPHIFHNIIISYTQRSFDY